MHIPTEKRRRTTTAADCATSENDDISTSENDWDSYVGKRRFVARIIALYRRNDTSAAPRPARPAIKKTAFAHTRGAAFVRQVGLRPTNCLGRNPTWKTASETHAPEHEIMTWDI